MNRLTPVILASLALPLAAAVAQPFSIDWYTIDGGGGTSSGDGFTLSGTIGQPDAGVVSGGGFTLQGGFWPGTLVEGPCNIADLVPPFGITDLQDIDAFIVAFLASDSPADLVPPFGIVDLADVDAFILAFLAGCP